MKNYDYFMKDVMEIVKTCEEIQKNDDLGGTTKEKAMIHAYEDIADICNWIMKQKETE